MSELVSRTISNFVDDVASVSPAPGGGSVAALSGALGAALGCMVAKLTLGKAGYEAAQAEIADALRKLEDLRGTMVSLVDEDTRAFNKVAAAYAMSRESGPAKLERSKAIQEATKVAAEVPLKLSRKCGAALDLILVLAKKGNPSAASDAGVAGLTLYAGLKGAALNVEINLASIKDQDFTTKMHKELGANTAFVDERLKEILTTVRSRMA